MTKSKKNTRKLTGRNLYRHAFKLLDLEIIPKEEYLKLIEFKK